MSDIKNKFVLVDNEIIAGRVSFHRELHKSPKGGGWWYYHKETKKLFLYGSSCDFGRCEKEDILKAELGGSLMNLSDYELIFDTRQNYEIMSILIEHLGRDEGIRACTQCDFI